MNGKSFINADPKVMKKSVSLNKPQMDIGDVEAMTKSVTVVTITKWEITLNKHLREEERKPQM
jgi:hypothetical protein